MEESLYPEFESTDVLRAYKDQILASVNKQA
jgi:hypothetical protein